MKRMKKMIPALVISTILLFAMSMTAFAAEAAPAAETASILASGVGAKAMAAAIVVGLVGLAGAVAMGMTASKAVEGIARQPEADGKIRTTFMLGLVFIETAIIYALIVAILIIFVL